MRTLLLVALLAVATTADAASNILNWKDNSGNEQNFDINRKQAACPDTSTIFIQIAQVGPNVTTFTDNSIQEGATYCYTVDASNTAGKSAVSNTAERTVPFSTPAPPSNLTVVPGP